MPTYSFACPACGNRFDEVMSIHADHTPACPECGAEVRKVFGSVGVTFKGSGFYRTDSRSKPAEAGSSSSSSAPGAPSAPSSPSSTSSD